MSFAGGQNIIVGNILLHNSPHALDIIAGMAPVALGIEVPDVKHILYAQMNARHGAGNLTRDKRLTANRTLMIEKNSIRGVHAISFAIVDGYPVGVELCHSVGTAGIKGRSFALWNLLRLAIKLGRGSLVESRLAGETENADRF